MVQPIFICERSGSFTVVRFYKSLEGFEGLWADMVLDAFSIGLGGALIKPQRQQELHDDFMAVFGSSGKAFTLWGQCDGLARFGVDQTRVFEPGDGFDDCDMADTKMPGEINAATDGVLSDDVSDGFDIVLCGFSRVCLANAGVLGSS